MSFHASGHVGAAGAVGGYGGAVVGGRGAMVGGAAGGVAAGGISGGAGGGVAVGGGAACGGMLGGAEVMCVEPAGTVQSVEWQYVGQGQGSFNTTQGYNFVGHGCGSYEQEVVDVPTGRKCRPLCLGLIPLVLLLLLLPLIMPSNPSATTPAPTGVKPFNCQDATNLTPAKAKACCETEGLFCESTTPMPPTVQPPIVGPPVVQPPVVQPPVMPTVLPEIVAPTNAPEIVLPSQGPRECVIWGDPHIITFDGVKGNWYGQGEAWIVKSPQVWIQGRFKPTPFTNGRAATDAIAIGGPFLQNHVLKVSALATGGITWDDQPILTTFPSSFNTPNNVGTITYDTQGRIVDDAMAHLPRHIVHASLPLGVTAEIMRWSHHVNVRLTMPPQQPQDGCCGNFNGNIADEDVAQIQARVGLNVAQGEALFNTYLPYRAAA